ncbi:hypothetical protein [Teredinibacter haidensis]|uniref:hypothetical protein n=1 Tax=Teredinibacter haidensis TaxID=2731755 RepID=UPI0009488C06|nr:hypothetical protein [Teredinibacter haidensis]
MSSELPQVEDYLRLFQRYGSSLDPIYKTDTGEDPYAFLFEQIILLLIRPSAFNLSLPESFRKTAHRYHRGDQVVRKSLSDPDACHFMLCSLYDLIMLKGGLSLKRQQSKQESP